MESNINHSHISVYSRNFSEKLSKGIFQKKKAITGVEIVELSKVRQVNYFILKALFDSWKMEFDNLKSPYFNYEADDVKAAAATFMNVLSRHILIERDNLMPLLVDAVAKSLVLIFSPYEFYIRELRNAPGGRVTKVSLRELSRYIKINGHLLQAYVDRFQSKGITEASAAEAEDIFNEVCEQFRDTPDEFDGYLAIFNEIVPLSIDDLYEQTGGKNPPAAEPVVVEKVEEKPPKTQQILLDTFEVEKKEALVEIHEKKAVDGIKKSITINQRFMFEKELFGGNKEEFERAIAQLDECKSRNEAMTYVSDNYLKKSWDTEREEVIEFLAILNRRFPE